MTNIESISILLVSELQRDYAISKLNEMPLDGSIEVTYRTKTKRRGLSQNAYYFMRVGEIAEQVFIDGKQFNTDCWHQYLKEQEMPERVIIRDGSEVSKWIEMPNRKLTVISTNDLSRGSFADYTTIVEAYGAGLGVKFKAR